VPGTTEQHIYAMTDAELATTALAKWGGTAEAFAETIIGVNPATFRRWRAGQSRMSKRRRHWFQQYLVPPTFPKEAL
jgi:hypothetical protein